MSEEYVKWKYCLCCLNCIYIISNIFHLRLLVEGVTIFSATTKENNKNNTHYVDSDRRPWHKARTTLESG